MSDIFKAAARQIGRYFDLQSTQREHDDENVILLARIRGLDGSEHEEQYIVKRRDIQQICDNIADREDVVEVWVYQKIYHNLKTPTDGMEDAPVIANAILGVAR